MIYDCGTSIENMVSNFNSTKMEKLKNISAPINCYRERITIALILIVMAIYILACEKVTVHSPTAEISAEIINHPSQLLIQ